MASNIVLLEERLRLQSKPKKPQKRWYKENGEWLYHFATLEELGGERPRGHPPLRFGPRGGVLLDEKQVWVEYGSDMLWVIKKLQRRRDGKTIAHLTHYGRRNEEPRRIIEATLRSSMEIYEEAILPITPGPRQKLLARIENPPSALILPFRQKTETTEPP